MVDFIIFHEVALIHYLFMFFVIFALIDLLIIFKCFTPSDLYFGHSKITWSIFFNINDAVEADRCEIGICPKQQVTVYFRMS